MIKSMAVLLSLGFFFAQNTHANEWEARLGNISCGQTKRTFLSLPRTVADQEIEIQLQARVISRLDLINYSFLESNHFLDVKIESRQRGFTELPTKQMRMIHERDVFNGVPEWKVSSLRTLVHEPEENFLGGRYRVSVTNNCLNHYRYTDLFGSYSGSTEESTGPNFETHAKDVLILFRTQD